MEAREVKQYLQLYFNGESTLEQERLLEQYFRSGKVAEELREYAEFFGGISELGKVDQNDEFQEEIMDYILENESKAKTRYLGMWKTVTGIAATVIIVLGGFLFYQQRQTPYADTFENPEDAYAYAVQTMQFVSGKYSQGLAELSNFEKLSKASDPIRKGVAPINEFFNQLEDQE